MKLPFVSRGRFEDVQGRVRELEAQLLDAKEERKRLTDVIAVKSLGFPIYGQITVPTEVEDEADRKYSPEKDSPEPIVAQPEEAPATRARQFVRRREHQNLEQARREEQDRERLRTMAGNVLNETVAAGREAAEQGTNGKH